MKPAGRTFVISGGASGLGLATAKELVANGASVALLDMNPENGAAAAKELGPAAMFAQCDVTDSASIASTVAPVTAFIAKTGHPIGGLITAAGVGFGGLMWNRKGEALDFEMTKLTINVNLLGTIDTIRQYLPLLAAAPSEGPDGERAVIITVASVAAYEGQRGQVAYAASKGGVRCMTLPMARDLSEYKVRVVSVAPGMFETSMTAVLPDKVRKSVEKSWEFPKRAGRPEEFASIVKGILEFGMVNGEVIRVDGASRMPSKL